MQSKFYRILCCSICLLISYTANATAGSGRYTVVDTGQIRCYNNRTEIKYPAVKTSYFGQDAQYSGNQPAYKDNRDGTISDLNTGLMWTQNPGAKKTLKQALAKASQCRTGGYKDWRLPTIKELYSLIIFSGTDPDPNSTDTSGQKPFINTKYFKFKYGNPNKNERIIDSQYATSTKYVSTTMNKDETMFGVNFADGRIKGYPVLDPRRGQAKTFCVLYVRGNPDYGRNDFKNNKDGTITDRATGLMWQQKGSSKSMNWQQALNYAENLIFAGYDDWRLPNVKELQTIIDYSRSPDTTNSAAIDPMFKTSAIVNEGGKKDFPVYWSSTTHKSLRGATRASYVAFGRALGWMQDRRTNKRQLLDVHGAGAQRSDPKNGNPSNYPYGKGPQGDVIRIYNYVRCVRAGVAGPNLNGPQIEKTYQGLDKDGGQRPQQTTRGGFVTRLDRNGDGKVSRTEFDGPANRFDDHDKNKDGFLTENEAPEHLPGRRLK